MGKSIRIVLIGGGVLIIVVVIATFVLISNLDKIVKHVVETVGSEVVGTKVALDSAEIKLQDASGSLSGLTVRNPSGFESPYAFELGRIQLTIDTASLGSDEIVLSEITVDRAHLTYEQQADANNLQTILDNLESAPDEPESAEDVLLVVETFRLHEAQVTVMHPELDEPLELTLPDVVLRDIGRVGAGATAASAAKQIIGAVLDATVDAAKQRAKDELEERLRQEVDERKQDAVESLKDRLLGD